MKRSSMCPGRIALTGVAAAALCLTVPNAFALGLGRLVVRSALGETLRAEIEVTSLTAEESANLKIGIAPPESYDAAGLDYNPVLPTTRAVLQVRDGRTFLGLTSDRVVLEPFVDVILELAWNSGRLVREYTLLIDPPPASTAKALAAAPAPLVVSPVVVTTAPAVQSPPAVPPQAAAPVAQAPAARPVAPPPTPPATVAATTERRVESRRAAAPEVERPASSYRVKAGDTLSRIAIRNLSSEVSLDQMLVALYQANPEAFMQENMNRLMAGAVLTVPQAGTAVSTSRAAARNIVLAHSADFEGYRQRVASAVGVAKTDDAPRRASGKVSAAMKERKQVDASTPDKLKLSKADQASAAREESRLSKEREAKDAAARALELRKNVEELTRLSAAASAAAPDAGATATSAAPSGPMPSVPVAAPVVAVAAPSSDPVMAPAASASPAVAMAAASAPIATPPDGGGEQESDTMGSLFDGGSGLALGIGGLTLAFLLGGYGAFRYTRRAKKQSGVTSFLESRLQPDSFFGASGGQRIDTREASEPSSAMSYSLSQIDAIGDVDPVAEADVYLAYGRDLQAEEILKEAMRSTPERMAIRLKLLEVYAKRRDAKGFEMLATQVFGLTQGQGEDWAKTQEMGAQLDPDNPLYQPGGQPEGGLGAGGGGLGALGDSTAPQSVIPAASGFSSTLGVPVAEPESISTSELDIDLDLGLDLDLDLAQQGEASLTTPSAMELTQPLPMTSRDTADPMDFELPLEAPPEPFSSTPASTFAPTMPPREDADPSPMSLDFELTPPPVAPEAVDSANELNQLEPSDTADDGVNPLQRKLDLAEEFRQIGDLEGARDLLQEVIDKAEGGLKAKAQSMFAKLS